MFNNVRGARVRQFAAIPLATALISLVAAWAPAPARTHSSDSAAFASRLAELSGVYVLQRASGARPPIPFEMSVAGGKVAGTVDGARVVVANEGSYTKDVDVT